MLRIIDATSSSDIEHIKELFREYAESLGFDLCFQDFEAELDQLPGKYSPPSGRLLLAFVGGFPAGCVALRQIEGDVCEMKRLYVRPAYRGSGLGRQLAEMIVEEGRKAGYRLMRLDTVSTMNAARAVYRSLGFVEIAPYTYNPLEQAVYMELKL
jgi:ribosomal protein S18 acetylase RimI-like enzyme